MGVKIFMAQNAVEVEKIGEDGDKSEFGEIQLQEVSVEDLLPVPRLRST